MARRRVAVLWTALFAFACIVLTSAAPFGPQVRASHADATTLPWMNTSLSPDQRADLLVPVLTLAQKVSLMHGIGDNTGSGFVGAHTGAIPPIPSVDFPGIHLTDGPIGVRQGTETATLLPAPIALASSWDQAIASAYGSVLGSEARAKNNDVIFAPMINMVRNPQGGRDFETMGEDPYLTSSIAVPEIKAIQAQGVMADPKHYLANNQEDDRMITNAQVDERTLHEIYAPAFEAAVEQAHAATVMVAYNKVNGAYNAQNCHTIQDILEGQFGFQGIVLSDYDSTYGMEVPSVNCGTNIELPTGEGLPGLGGQMGTPLTGGYDYLPNDVAAGTVTMATIDEAVHRILRTFFAFGVFDRPACPDVDRCTDTNVSGDSVTALQVAEAGDVLLKNTAPSGAATPLLPLDTSKISSIAVIGPFANVNNQGGGSSAATPTITVTALQGITERVGPNIKVSYDSGTNAATAAALAATSSVAIVVVGDQMMEGGDRPCLDLSCTSSPSTSTSTDQDALIQAVTTANPHTIVVLNSGAPDLMPWVNSVPSILEAWYGGEENGRAIAALLFGDVNPSGKLPDTFPVAMTDDAANTPQQYPGIAETAVYSEGVFMGYRHFDQNNITPLFPFGHGLSYTTFGYRNLAIAPSATSSTTTTVSFDLQNTGCRAGAEVAQLYLGFPTNSAVPEPPKWLRNFKKVYLQPGESQHVTLTIDKRALSYWNVGNNGWSVQPGSFTVMIGSSSRDMRLQGSFVSDANAATSQTSPAVSANTPPVDVACTAVAPATMAPSTTAAPATTETTPAVAVASATTAPPVTTGPSATTAPRSTTTPPVPTAPRSTTTPPVPTAPAATTAPLVTAAPSATFAPTPTQAAAASATSMLSVAATRTSTALPIGPSATPFASPGMMAPVATTGPAPVHPPTVAPLPTLLPLVRPTAAPVVHYYFAGGENSKRTRSTLSLLNTRPTPAEALLTFYFAGGAVQNVRVSINPHTVRTVPVSTLIDRDGPFGLHVSSASPIAAQLTLDQPGRDGDTIAPAMTTSKTWYLAEGYTGLTFHESAALLNPGARAAHVLLYLLPLDGRAARNVLVTVKPRTQTVVNVNALLPGRSVGLAATSDRGVVVERTLRFSRASGGSDYGLTTRLGATAASTSWLFAEGTTANHFQTFFSIMNPGVRAAHVTARFKGLSGRVLDSKTLTIAPRTRQTIILADVLHASSVSTIVSSDRLVVVESPEYSGSPNAAGVAGSDAFGQTTGAARWSFAAGVAGGVGNLSEFFLLYNPSAGAIPVRLVFYDAYGKTTTRRVVVPAHARATLDLRRLAPSIVGAHGVTLASTNGQKFVVEQTVFTPHLSTLRTTQGLAQP